MKTSAMGDNGKMGWLNSIIELEALAGEGIGLPRGLPQGRQVNIFGRRLLLAEDGPIEFAAGLSMSGIRSAAFVSGKELVLGLSVLEEIARHQAPIVVYVYEAFIAELLPQLNRLPCFVLSASNVQDALDQALLARRVTEMSLLPGILLLEHSGSVSTEPAGMPTEAQLLAFCGSPDEGLDCPTPAQEILFGPHRRRVPRWFNHDLPALHGAWKSPLERATEVIAREKFVESHLDGILEASRAAFQTHFGRQPARCYLKGPARAEGLVLANGLTPVVLHAGMESFAPKAKRTQGILEIAQWRPFPSEALRAAMATTRHFTVIETPGSSFKTWIQGEFSLSSSLEWHFGTATAPLDLNAAAALFENMDKGGPQRKDFVIGPVVGSGRSGFPQHEVLLHTIQRAYPKFEELALVKRDLSSPTAVSPERVSMFVRQYRDSGPPYSRLSHFAQHTVYLHHAGVEQKKMPDPFKSLALVPAATAALGRGATGREKVPVLEAEWCTACGVCSVVCPHAALPGLALNLENILRGGMDIAAKRSNPLSSLTPMVKNLAKIAAQKIIQSGKNDLAWPVIIPDAFSQLAGQMGLQGEKLAQTQQDIEYLVSVLKPWPAIVTDALFRDPEAMEQGSGLLFSLVSDPVACTGCGICANACPEKAIRMEVSEGKLVQEEARRFALWEVLPDMSDTSLNALAGPEGLYPIAALYWNRKRFRAMAGGGAAGEENNGAKALLHALQSVVLHLQAEKQEKLVQQVKEMCGQLSAKIHGALSDALPKQAFSALSGALAQVQGAKTPLDTLLSGLGEHTHLGKVDASVLQRQVDLFGQLQNVSWLLREGPSGVGRAPYGIVIAGEGPQWVGQFPYNFFTVPVLLHSAGDFSNYAYGLVQGQLRHYLDNLRLLRRAALEVKGRYQPSEHDAALAALCWEDLSEDEKHGLPPLLLLFFGTNPIPEGVFKRSLPIVSVQISDGSFSTPSDLETALTGLRIHFLRGIPSAQSSLANPGHFFQSVQTVLQGSSPAYLHLLAPEIPDLDILSASRIALQTRAFPMLLVNPNQETPELSEGLSLKGNPERDKDWVGSEMDYSRLFGENKPYTFTYVDWLNMLPGRESFVREQDIRTSNPVQVSTYLDLAPEVAKGKIPLVVQTLPNRSVGQPFEVLPGAIALAQIARRNWNTLRKMSGFEQEQKGRADIQMEARYQDEIRCLKQDFERQLKLAEEKWKGQMLEKLRDNLVQLAKGKK